MRLLPLVALAIAVPTAAQAADLGTLSMGLKFKREDGTYREFGQMTELKEFFNLATCQCHTPVGLELSLNRPGDLGTFTVEIWIGSNCATFEESRDTRCVKVKDIDVNDLNDTGKVFTLDIDPAKIMFPKQSSCGSLTGENTIFGLVDEGKNGSYEHTWQLPSTVKFDTQAPTPVSEVTTSPGEDAINLSWKVPTGGISDIRSIQVLCANSLDGMPILKKPASEPEYVRADDLESWECPMGADVPDAGAGDAGAGGDAGIPDAGVPDAPTGPPSGDAGTPKLPALPQTMAAFNDLDPAYICSGVLGGTAGGARIDLSDTDNVIPFAANEKIVTKVVSIDNSRNFSHFDVTTPSDLPHPVTDAWESYHDAGGDADGGFCFVATAVYGDYDHPYVKVLREFRDQTLARTGAGRAFIAWYYAHSPPWADWLRAHPVWRITVAVALFPVVALAWIWNGLGLLGTLAAIAFLVVWRRYRRQRRRLAAAATTLLLLAFVRPASAQVFLDEGLVEETGPPKSWWNVDLKLGPYYPDIDGESGLTGKPYATMFGDDWSLMFQAELDRFFFQPEGQLGLGLSLGYMANSAKSFKTDADGHTLPDMRSSDTTRFRMIPAALLLVYRSTALADRTVIPLVPYVKAGLSYYVWQITKGNGDLSSVAGDEARGGTLGFQATVGLALRADALDREASRSLTTELGVEHAGFFFDLTYANVSGLGMSHKLHVGDLTWAAGLNFEF